MNSYREKGSVGGEGVGSLWEPAANDWITRSPPPTIWETRTELPSSLIWHLGSQPIHGVPAPFQKSENKERKRITICLKKMPFTCVKKYLGLKKFYKK